MCTGTATHNRLYTRYASIHITSLLSTHTETKSGGRNARRTPRRLNIKDYIVCVQHRGMCIHKHNAGYTNKVTGRINLVECMTNSKNVRGKNPKRQRHPRTHNHTELPECFEYAIYVCTHHFQTHTYTTHLGTHLAHPGVCVPHLHNHRVRRAGELVGRKGRAGSGQEGHHRGGGGG